jgi:Glycosyl hydrolase family 76
MLLFGFIILSLLSAFFFEPVACNAPVNAMAKIHDSLGSRAKNLDRLRASIRILQQPDYFSPTFGFPTASEWTSTVLATVLIDSALATNDPLYFEGFVAVFNNESVLELLFQGNDDKLWVCLACLRGAAYAANHDPQSADTFLERAQLFYNSAAAGWQNATCHGGMFSAPGSSYKNAVTNELWITASASMYQIFGEESMLDAALQGWIWFNGSGMINSEGLVNDGLTNNCTSAFCLEVAS